MKTYDVKNRPLSNLYWKLVNVKYDKNTIKTIHLLLLVLLHPFRFNIECYFSLKNERFLSHQKLC